VKYFNQQEFNQFVVKNQVIGFFPQPVKLKSGRLSHWYVNWRRVTEDVYLTHKLSGFVINYLKDNFSQLTCLLGVPEGATKLAIIIDFQMALNSGVLAQGSHPLPMLRGKPKEHGSPADRLFLGRPPEDGCLVLEDVTTTGGSLIRTLEQLKSAGIKVDQALGLTNRMQKNEAGLTVSQALSQMGVNYHALSTALDLLPMAVAESKPDSSVLESIVAEFARDDVEIEL